jgi:hypothetical protein
MAQQYVPASLLDPLDVEQVRVEYWRMLFDAYGYPEGLNPKSKLTPDTIHDAFVTGRVTDELIEALETIRDFGTHVDALHEALHERGLTMEPRKDEGPREFAVRVYVEQKKDAEMAEAILRAHASVFEHAGRRVVHEFAGHAARSVGELERKERLLRDGVSRWCDENGMSPYARVKGYADDRGIHFHVVHGNRLETPVTVEEQRRGVTRMRRAVFDSIRYDPSSGRVKIGATTKELVRMYQVLCGRVLFNNESFFDAPARCTLRPLQRKGQAALDAHSVPEIEDVRLRECLWYLRGSRLWLRADDCFDEIEHLGLSRAEGDLVEAKIQVLIAEKRPRRISVTIKAPNRIDFNREHRYEQSIETYLDQIGVRLRGSEEEEDDLWSLYPWAHPETRWRTAFGARVDWMLTTGILKPVALSAVAGAHRRPREVAVTRLPTGELYGVGRTEPDESRPLTATDVEGLKLDVVQLAQVLRADLGLEGEVRRVDTDRLIDLGQRSFSEKARIRFLLLAREPTNPPAIAALASGSAGRGFHTVVLVPPGRKLDAPVSQLEVQLTAPPFHHVVRAAVLDLGLDEDVEALVLAPPSDRVVIDTPNELAWLDGVLLQLKPVTFPFRMLSLLAKRRPRGIPVREISAALSPARGEDPNVASQAKSDLLDAIRKSFTAAQKPVPTDLREMISTGAGSYRLTFRAFVR